jgi:hypothetical protein
MPAVWMEHGLVLERVYGEAKFVVEALTVFLFLSLFLFSLNFH